MLKKFNFQLIIVFINFLIYSGSVYCDPINNKNRNISNYEIGKSTIRTSQEIEWRSEERLSDDKISDRWIAQISTTTSDESEIPLKRRRIRKRKRRPIITITNRKSDDLPKQLDLLPAPSWDELASHNAQKPHKRRKIFPNFYDHDDIDEGIILNDNDNDNKQASLIATENFFQSTTIPPNLPPDDQRNKIGILKNLLKKFDNMLSLSEILQSNNLTLSELLEGNQKALSTLSEKTMGKIEEVLPVSTSTEGMKSINNRNYEQLTESIESSNNKEMLELQRKRLSLLHNNKNNQLLTNITKVEVINEATTDRRIFVPSRFIKQQDGKIKTITVTSIPMIFNISKINLINEKKNKPPLPITSAKLLKSIKNPSTTILPTKSIKIDINEISDNIEKNITIEQQQQQQQSADSDGPLKITINLNDLKGTKNNNTLDAMVIMKNMNLSAGDDQIIEILKNPIDRENLTKILKIRNMTLNELIDQRERGSSQLHLSDIFKNNFNLNNNNNNNNNNDNNNNVDETDSMNNNDHEDSKEENIVVVIETTNKLSSSENLLDVTTTTTTTTEKQQNDVVTITSFPTFKIGREYQQQKDKEALEWDDIDPLIISNVYEITENDGKKFHITNNNEYNLNRHLYKPDVTILDNEQLINLPNGVKSAIIASFIIIGLTFLIFITILIIFRWNQKQRHLYYSDNYLCNKSKSPILKASYHKRSLRSLMSETLSKKKNYYKNQLQSIWNNNNNNNNNFNNSDRNHF